MTEWFTESNDLFLSESESLTQTLFDHKEVDLRKVEKYCCSVAVNCSKSQIQFRVFYSFLTRTRLNLQIQSCDRSFFISFFPPQISLCWRRPESTHSILQSMDDDQDCGSLSFLPNPFPIAAVQNAGVTKWPFAPSTLYKLSPSLFAPRVTAHPPSPLCKTPPSRSTRSHLLPQPTAQML